MRFIACALVFVCGCSADVFTGDDAGVAPDAMSEALAIDASVVDAPMTTASDAPSDACDEPSTYYLDGDGDGYGGTTTVTACAPPSSQWITRGGDCDDGNSVVHPGQQNYFTSGYTPTGKTNVISFDYDCDGSELESGSPAHAACHFDVLTCVGDGYVEAVPRNGSNVDAFCGSMQEVTCGGLSCVAGVPFNTTSAIACH